MISISVAHNEARLTATRDFIDTGSANGKLRIYGNTRPANGAAAGADPLVEILLDKPCGTVSAGALSLNASDLPLIANSGAPTWARVVNGNGAHAFDCDAAGPGGTAEVIVSEATLYAGGQVALVSAVLG